MAASPSWSIDTVLLIEADPPAGATHRVEGLPGVARAAVRVAPAGELPRGPSIRLRPVVEPPGPFDAAGLLMFSPFIEADPDPERVALRAFERRIGPRYYEFLLAQRYRYAASCVVEAVALDAPGTCAELYSIDAASIEEAKALDAAAEAPADILAIYEECRTFIVPGSHREVWLVPIE